MTDIDPYRNSQKKKTNFSFFKEKFFFCFIVKPEQSLLKLTLIFPRISMLTHWGYKVILY